MQIPRAERHVIRWRDPMCLLHRPLLGLLCALTAAGACGDAETLWSTAGRRVEPLLNALPAGPGIHAPVTALVARAADGYYVHCTATLIAPTVLMTAAHCLAFAPQDKQLMLFVGSDLGQEPLAEALIPTTRAHLHPDYDADAPVPGHVGNYRDIALVEIDAPVEGIAPMRMINPADARSFVRTGEVVTLVGFGRTDPKDGWTAGTRQHGESQIATVGATELRIYAGGDATQKCLGDSGGPTLVDVDPGAGTDWRIVAVASRSSDGCTGGSLDTRVDAYLDWIHQTVTIVCGSGLSPDCSGSSSDQGAGDLDAGVLADASETAVVGDGGASTDTIGDAHAPLGREGAGGCALAPAPSPGAFWTWLIIAWLVRRRGSERAGSRQ